jgi:hypothetical protein
MALSGTVNTGNYQGRYVSLTWTGTQSVANNTTTISWTLKGAGEASSGYYNSGPFKVTIDGTVVYESDTRIKLYNGTTITSGTTTVAHGTDGKKKITISVSAAIWAYDYNKSGSEDFTLNTIPRKATITSAPNFNDEGNPAISYSNPKDNGATSLQACIASSDGKTIYVAYRDISKTGTSYTFSLTTAERTALRNACKNANSMSVRFYVKTVISGNSYYHYKTKTLSIINATPTIAPTAIEEQDDNGIKNSAATGSTSRWVKGYSDIAYAFNATLKKGATVKSYSVSCGTKTGSAASGVLYNIENKDVKFTLIDSRGNKVEQTVSGTLVNYVKPTCSLGVSAAMSGDTTAKATLNIKGTFFNGALAASGTNALTVQYRYKPEGGSYSAWTAVSATKSGNSYSVNTTISPDFDYQTTYTFQARVQDDMYKAHSQYINSNDYVLKIQPIFDWSDTDFNFNVPVKFSGDTWHNLTLASTFKNYNDNAANNPKYKVCGNMVFVCGVVSPKATMDSSLDGVTFATGIPAAYRPAIAQHCVCQGSSMNRWLLTVSSGGELTIARYGTTATASMGTSTWLPFSFTYMV